MKVGLNIWSWDAAWVRPQNMAQLSALESSIE